MTISILANRANPGGRVRFKALIITALFLLVSAVTGCKQEVGSGSGGSGGGFSSGELFSFHGNGGTLGESHGDAVLSCSYYNPDSGDSISLYIKLLSDQVQ